ncbi:hypothetical protein AMTRI_Chr07g76840 [Amborella trichopoda]
MIQLGIPCALSISPFSSLAPSFCSQHCFLEHGIHTDLLRGWLSEKQCRVTGLRKLWTNMKKIIKTNITQHGGFEGDVIRTASVLIFRVDYLKVFAQWCHYLIGFTVPHEVVMDVQWYRTRPSLLELACNSASSASCEL